MRNKMKKSQEPQVDKKLSATGSDVEGVSEDFWDRDSAFVHMAVKNRQDISSANSREEVSSSSNNAANHLQLATALAVEMPANVLAAQNIATQGNYTFVVEKNYTKALHFYTEAIKLDPTEYKFFGNRACCYAAFENYEKGLEDADAALSIEPNWPKGHFWRGFAYEGLGRFADAERCYDRVVQLEPKCPEAPQAKLRVMMKQLMALGFSTDQSFAAAQQYRSVKAAAQSLVKTRLLSSSALTEMFDSDDEDFLMNGGVLTAAGGSWSSSAKSSSCSSSVASGPAANQQLPNAYPPPRQAAAAVSDVTNTMTVTTNKSEGAANFKVDPLLDPKNPLKWETLWVGNLVPQTTEKQIADMFSKYGKLRQLNMMLEKHCSFVSFADWRHAGQAMADLQNQDWCGQRLLIKFPDRALDAANAAAAAKRGQQTPAAGQLHSAHRGPLILRKAKK